MTLPTVETHIPMILAPAGSRLSFLAAVEAGADAVYCGLKQFSARMEAKNFGLEEMARLIGFARSRKVRVHVAFNTLLKPDETETALRLLDTLNRAAPPDAIIFQDLAVPVLARQVGYAGELHLSTLGNASFPGAVGTLTRLGINQLVIPRELNIDEIRRMAEACPREMGLETFIHGALCYGVSGRCYWSSYLGGKSSLRGRCVQPCRRLYSQSGAGQRLFSCMDLSLDALVKVLRQIPQIRTWKIEGRKKGPHYVYYTVSAYRMLRDEGDDSRIRKAAMDLLSRSLGRPGTHYHFLPQRPYNPVEGVETGSGFLLGRVKGPPSGPFFNPRGELLPGDVLRVGYEDSPGHRIHRVSRGVPARGRYQLGSGGSRAVAAGTPVFLVDRREPALADALKRQESAFEATPEPDVSPSGLKLKLPRGGRKRARQRTLILGRSTPRAAGDAQTGVWVSGESLDRIAGKRCGRVWWTLPPVIWPEEEEACARAIDTILRRGGSRFILNQPWQLCFFEGKKSQEVWAGPFCNAANGISLQILADLGFTGAVVSPELASGDLLALPAESPLPLGIVVFGSWPLCISRVVSDRLDVAKSFSSPKGEQAWVRRYGGTYWVFPTWQIDLRNERQRLHKAGFELWVEMIEPLPKGVRIKPRPGKWNWDIGLD
ncbi:MAG: U32 family peptidase [Desulfobacterales bacterium]